MSIYNLSSVDLKDEDLSVLTKGLSFSPTPNTPTLPQQLELLRHFNKFAQSLRSVYVHATRKPNVKKTIQLEHTDPQLKAPTLHRPMKFLPKQSHITFAQIYSGEPILELYIDNTKNAINENLPTLFTPIKNSNISFKERQAIKKFTQTRTQLTLKPADKNLGLVVLNTDDYLHLCTAHLSNTNTYRQCNSFPAATIHKTLQDTLVEFSEILKPHKKLYDCLLPSEKKTQTPRFYGIPKVHKRFTILPPIRPIVSHSNSLLTPTGKFIDHVLQPIAKSYPDYLHNSTALIRLLQYTHIPDNVFLVTIDVESLYPSIPQAECLSMIYEEMHARKDLQLFSPNLIIKLLHTNMSCNYFELGPLIFQQVKGTAMGAAFSPTVANIFLSVIFRRFLSKQHLKPLLLKRYIDDIFLIWQHSYED